MSTNRHFRFMVTAAIGILVTPQVGFSQNPEGTIRIGTFDSRCLAIAYGRSAGFAKYVTSLRADLQKAKDAGDTTRAMELERLGSNSQVIMHQQAFSTGSISDIMATIREKLPTVAAKHMVKLIVSRWELFALDGSVQKVDITDDLVALFAPDARTLRTVEEVKKMDPVPMAQIPLDPRK